MDAAHGRRPRAHISACSASRSPATGAAAIRFDPRLGFDSFIVQIDRVLDEAARRVGHRVRRVLRRPHRAAATRRCARTRVKHLVLASALPPDYEPDERYDFYKRAPRAALPRLPRSHRRDGCRRNCARRSRAWPDRARVRRAQGLRVLTAPVVADAGCAIAWSCSRTSTSRRTCAACTRRRWSSPATEDLDRTVPVDAHRATSICLPGAELVVLERTGHMGTVTRPVEFAQPDRTTSSRGIQDMARAATTRMAG